MEQNHAIDRYPNSFLRYYNSRSEQCDNSDSGLERPDYIDASLVLTTLRIINHAWKSGKKITIALLVFDQQ